MKKILALALSLGIVLTSVVAQASSSLSIPTAVRLVNPLGTTTGTDNNPLSTKIIGNLTGITNPVTIGAGTITVIVNDVGIKDNGNSITIDSTQLPSALDANGNFKVAQQGTVNVKLDSNIDTNLGKVKVTDGTDVLGVNTNGSIDVNIVSNTGVGSVVSGYYELSIAAGATTEVGSYTVTAGKTLYLHNISVTFIGEALTKLKLAGVTKKVVATVPTNPSPSHYLGDSYTVPAGTVMSATVTNNEASAIIAYVSWSGLEK